MTKEKKEFYGVIQQDCTVIKETMTFNMFMVGKSQHCFKNKILRNQQHTILCALLTNRLCLPLNISQHYSYCFVNCIPAYGMPVKLFSAFIDNILYYCLLII